MSRSTHPFPCAKCNGNTRVTDTRLRPNAIDKYRRRKCQKCGYKFTTREVLDDATDDYIMDYIKTKDKPFILNIIRDLINFL